MAERDQADTLGVNHDEERTQRRNLSADPKADANIRAFITGAGRLATDLKCEDVVVIDVRSISDITDYIMIGTGTSDRQMKSVADDIEELAEQHGLRRFGQDRDGAMTWIVLDFIDVVVHLFEPNTRAHYDLEMLWGDGEQVDWKR